VRFVVNEVALAQIFHRGFQFSSVDIIPPMEHIRLVLDACIRSRKEESLGTTKTIGVLEIGGGGGVAVKSFFSYRTLCIDK
jgi:hypothetical protein